MSCFKSKLKKAIEEIAKEKKITYEEALITIYRNIVKGELNETNL